MPDKILIGYDASSRSGAALTWALDEAVRAGTPVELVYADEYPLWVPAASMAPAPGARPQSYVEDVIEAMLRRAVDHARETHPLARPTWSVVHGRPATCLIGLSERARMLVLGGPGHHAVTGLLSSVSAEVSARARCGVVVVRGATDRDGPVVASVDDSPAAPAVLAFAADQAAARKAPLHILRASATGECASLGALVTDVRDAFPDLWIEAEATVGDPAAALTAASTTAQLLVVGSRGRGTVRGLLLGSVSRHLLRHTGCPVAVLPTRQPSCLSCGPVRWSRSPADSSL